MRMPHRLPKTEGLKTRFHGQRLCMFIVGFPSPSILPGARRRKWLEAVRHRQSGGTRVHDRLVCGFFQG